MIIDKEIETLNTLSQKVSVIKHRLWSGKL